MSVQDIITTLQEKTVKQHLKDHAIVHVAIGGSFATWKNKQNSDIDLIVEVDDNTVGTDYFSLPRYLEWKLWRKIDLIDKDYINTHVKSSVLSHTISVW
jgi:predicted nucleotidyltransferase